MEPRNIVGDDAPERVSAEAAALSSRVQYYGRLTASSDRLLVCPLSSLHFTTNTTACFRSAARFHEQTSTYLLGLLRLFAIAIITMHVKSENVK